jgi:hypothetical protein
MRRLAGRERHSRENEKEPERHTLKAYYVCLKVKKDFVKRLECVPWVVLGKGANAVLRRS